MKMTKLASMTFLAVLALWNVQAGAIISTPQFITIDCNLIAVQQGLDFSNSAPNTYIATEKAMKITTKDLLSFLATSFNTNWPVGARLAMDYFSSDIYIVDKTGTNPVFNVSIGTNVGGTNVVNFTFDSDEAVFTGKELATTNGFLKEVQTGIGFFRLFVEQNGSVSTDLSFQGLSVTKIAESFKTPGKVAVEKVAFVAGDGTINNKWTVVSGKVTGAGKWKSLPPA